MSLAADEKKDDDPVFDPVQKEQNEPAPPNSQLVAPNSSTALSMSNKQKLRKTRAITLLLRTLLLDLPLAALFALFLTVYVIREVHNVYYRPLFDRARRTDDDLLEEFTYYERQCNEYDLTTRNIQDLLLLPQHNNTSSSSILPAALDTMMTHGALVIPHILSPDLVRDLRAYIVRRNAAVTAEEEYPVSQGEHRVSYGIDATEDPAVSAAIQAVATHPVVQPLLQQLLGDPDPASAEITAITAYYGSPDQIWHADTKGEGNALKFARTYSHSYSLFLPLQDTSASMGPTDICPGTHYCANGLEDLCQDTRMGLHLATPAQIFPAGYGALLNQHVWHRGAAHTNATAPERVVFILSFLARPQLGTADARQLSRGTYFHQKWNMWGHTWRDLQNPRRRMKWSWLRCLHLWSANGNWGYDLVTAVFMRFSNEQLEDEDLEERFLPRLEQLQFPRHLWGRVLEDSPSQKESWQVFLQETADQTVAYVQDLVVWVHAGYAGLVLVAALLVFCWTRRRRASTSSQGVGGAGRLLRNTAIRLFVSHGALLAATAWVLHRTRTSQWGSDILSGRTLMRPFPPLQLAREDDLVSAGPTTMPQRPDVLIGTRFDAPFLGAYDTWLDYHPGNLVFRTAATSLASLYHSGNGNDISSRRVVQEVIDQVDAQDGRFLHQDYRNGDWRLMTKSETRKAVQEVLAASNSAVLASLRKSIHWMMADYRFGLRRNTALARISQVHLNNLLNRIFDLESNTTADVAPKKQPLSFMPRKHILPSSVSLSPPSRRSGLPSQQKKDNDLQVGTLVWVRDDEDEWFPGSITDVRKSGRFRVAFDDGLVNSNLPRRLIRKHYPLTEGDRVVGCFDQDLMDCWDGTVGRISPSGRVMVEFDDGDVEWAMLPHQYYVPPYRYQWYYY